jgi:hypothetical protein
MLLDCALARRRAPFRTVFVSVMRSFLRINSPIYNTRKAHAVSASRNAFCVGIKRAPVRADMVLTRDLCDAYQRRCIMNVIKALATVAAAALAFGAAGMGIGYGLGKVAPGFFRQTLPVRDPATFNPVEIGLGLGLTNGLIWGMVIGLVLVAILAWKEVRTQRRPQTPGTP